MFDDDVRRQEELQHTKRRLPLIFLSAILILAVGGGGVLAWQLLSSPSFMANGSPAGPPATQASQTTVPGSQQGKGTPPTIAAEVRQQVAQQFQLSVSQLQAQLQSGTPIETLAMQAGMSQERWRTFVIDAYQSAYDHAVSVGAVTQQRADHDMHNIRLYPLSALDGWVTGDCLGTSS
jgi:hypothetical protein